MKSLLYARGIAFVIFFTLLFGGIALGFSAEMNPGFGPSILFFTILVYRIFLKPKPDNQNNNNDFELNNNMRISESKDVQADKLSGDSVRGNKWLMRNKFINILLTLLFSASICTLAYFGLKETNILSSIKETTYCNLKDVDGKATKFASNWNTSIVILNDSAFDSNNNVLGVFHDGIRFGLWREYYNNNQIAREGEFYNGEMNGYFKHYWCNGKLAHEGEFKSGNTSNKSIVSGIPKSGRFGIHKFYYTNGFLQCVLNHKNGNYHGKSVHYWLNGVKKAELEWANGLTVSKKEWDVNGNPITSHSFIIE